MISLQGKNAFVIGATTGLGLAVAKSYVEAGAQVVIGGRRHGDVIAAEIGASFVAVDVTDESSVAVAFDSVAQRLGKLDILVNNAGVYPSSMLENMTAEMQQRNLNVNVNGVIWSLKYATRHMNDGGSIINTASIGAHYSMPGVGAYSAAKAAVCSLSQTAALEFAARGIRVNCISPSTVLGTEMNEELAEEEQLIINTLTPLGRISEMSDYLGVYILLASDAGRFINGQDIRVDGGLGIGVPPALIDKLLG